MMLSVHMPAHTANAALKDGRFGKVLSQAMERMKPESAYFAARDGDRTGYFFFDLAEASDIPSICEPFFVELGAKIELTPAMTPDDVQKGLAKAGVG